ncbi:hypothetical protein TUM4644_03520 [Shewanella colwelliana]|uniref:ROK family protein n=1 Tax=Shewanella colwelliana TaxID=23 RepID=UPI001BBD3114|nr:ROK family protein [Shewanella colwelliana]GIU17815.1 hypothetical protein TUM4644_03520 [Shewanella colwelliana]
MQSLTIDIGGTTALFEIVQQGRTEQYKIATGEHFTVDDLNQQIADLESDYGLSDYALGVAVPGLVKGNQLVSCKISPKLNGLSIDKIISRAAKVGIYNDIDAGMLAICDVKNDCELLLTSGMGIGMAIAIKGQLFTGAAGMAGELGHCRVMTEAGEYSVEQLASGESIRLRGLKTSQDLYRAGSYLGMGLAWAVNLFNPNRIWLAGQMINNPDYHKGCIDTLKQLALTAPMTEVKIARVDDMETLVCRGLQVLLRQ